MASQVSPQGSQATLQPKPAAGSTEEKMQEQSPSTQPKEKISATPFPWTTTTQSHPEALAFVHHLEQLQKSLQEQQQNRFSPQSFSPPQPVKGIPSGQIFEPPTDPRTNSDSTGNFSNHNLGTRSSNSANHFSIFPWDYLQQPGSTTSTASPYADEEPKRIYRLMPPARH